MMYRTSAGQANEARQAQQSSDRQRQRELLSLSWYSSVLTLWDSIRRGLTLRYPGFQSHWSEAIQALLRGFAWQTRANSASTMPEPQGDYRSASGLPGLWRPGRDSSVVVTRVEMARDASG